MKRKLIFTCLLAAFSLLTAHSQQVAPAVYYTDSIGNIQQATSIDEGQAPLEVEFRANPTGTEGFFPTFEWHFHKMDQQGGLEELFVRYEENTQYTFYESGTYNVVLKWFTNDGTGLVERDSTTIKITILESRLEFPNAFSPNGDGINDTFRAKEGWKSIVSFHAVIVNRWGQKMYEWDDPNGEWDGTFNGHPVKDGVYFLWVNAKGADGHVYHIRKDVNVLRGYTEGTNSGI